MLTERAVETQEDVFMCLADYTKAFDKMRREQIFEEVHRMDLYGKNLYLLRDLYWNQTACVRVKGECSEYAKIE